MRPVDAGWFPPEYLLPVLGEELNFGQPIHLYPHVPGEARGTDGAM
jgi:hypothetical protein